MNLAGNLQLVLLAAIWGGSFLFMRITVPAVGASTTVFVRLLLGALFLSAVCLVQGQRLALRSHWRSYVILGVLNTGLPFLLFGIAARSLPAGLLSILNATTTLWGAVIGAFWLRTPLNGKTVLGLLLGVSGVALLVGLDRAAARPGAGLAIACGLLAAFCYGVAAVYTRQASPVAPMANAQGSLWVATLMVLPALLWEPSKVTWSAPVAGALLGLGVVCSGLAYLIYFRMLSRYGAQQVLTVAFLIPLFAVLWGVLFLAEPIGAGTLLGAPAVLAGTALVSRGQRSRAAMAR